MYKGSQLSFIYIYVYKLQAPPSITKQNPGHATGSQYIDYKNIGDYMGSATSVTLGLYPPPLL